MCHWHILPPKFGAVNAKVKRTLSFTIIMKTVDMRFDSDMIQRGYNLIDKISDNDDFLEEWDDEYSPAYKREVVVVK